MKSSIEKQSRLDTQAHHEMWAGVEGGMRLWTGDESVSQQGGSQRGALPKYHRGACCPYWEELPKYLPSTHPAHSSTVDIIVRHSAALTPAVPYLIFVPFLHMCNFWFNFLHTKVRES